MRPIVAPLPLDIESGLAGEVDAWLADRAVVRPEFPLVWAPHGGAVWHDVAVEGIEQLAALVSALDAQTFGILRSADPSIGRWGQTMHGPDLWIVEVHDGSAADFAQRAHRGGPGGYPAGGHRGDGALDIESFRPVEVALILWAWMHGGLPTGYARTLRHLSDGYRRRYGLLEDDGS